MRRAVLIVGLLCATVLSQDYDMTPDLAEYCSLIAKDGLYAINTAQIVGERAPSHLLLSESAVQTHVNPEIGKIKLRGKFSAIDTNENHKDMDYASVAVNIHAPSLHTIDGKSFAMELDVINTLVRGEEERNEFAVLSLLFESTSEATPFFDSLTPSNWNNLALDLKQLITSDMDVYTYQNHFTTPPCSQYVNYFVGKQTFKVNENILKEFQEYLKDQPQTQASFVQMSESTSATPHFSSKLFVQVTSLDKFEPALKYPAFYVKSEIQKAEENIYKVDMSQINLQNQQVAIPSYTEPEPQYYIYLQTHETQTFGQIHEIIPFPQEVALVAPVTNLIQVMEEIPQSTYKQPWNQDSMLQIEQYDYQYTPNIETFTDQSFNMDIPQPQQQAESPMQAAALPDAQPEVVAMQEPQNQDQSVVPQPEVNVEYIPEVAADQMPAPQNVPENQPQAATESAVEDIVGVVEVSPEANNFEDANQQSTLESTQQEQMQMTFIPKNKNEIPQWPTANQNVNANVNGQKQKAEAPQMGPVLQEQTFSSKCITIFSQCNYQGEKLEACDNLGAINDFNYPIHSIYVPEGLSFTLYESDDFSGEKLVFKQSQNCLLKPVFVQMNQQSPSIAGQKRNLRSARS